MTLTLEAAKHAIDAHNQVFRIVEYPIDLSDYSVTRNEAKEINEYDPRFKPCIVVTTAREALDAAWELAHEPEDGVIPDATGHICRAHSDGKYFLDHWGPAVSAIDTYAERRLLDPPEPEPWEVSRYCYARGDVYERDSEEGGGYWTRPGDETPYSRQEMLLRNPRPVTIEGETE